MAQSDLNTANNALRLIGHRAPLTSLSDTTAEGVACNAIIDDCKKALLRMHPWNFAVKRKKIQAFPQYAISNVTYVSSELIEVTHAAGPTYVAGQYVTVTGVAGATGANGRWEVASVPGATTVRLTAIDVTSSTILGTYSSGGYIRRTPASDYSYLYSLPSDCLRLLDFNPEIPDARYRIEGSFILADTTSAPIRYIYDVTDYTTMDAMFYQVLSHWLAYHLCDHITASDGKKNELHTYLYGGQGKRGILPQARFVSSSENSLSEMEADDWVSARTNGVAT